MVECARLIANWTRARTKVETWFEKKGDYIESDTRVFKAANLTIQ